MNRHPVIDLCGAKPSERVLNRTKADAGVARAEGFRMDEAEVLVADALAAGCKLTVGHSSPKHRVTGEGSGVEIGFNWEDPND